MLCRYAPIETMRSWPSNGLRVGAVREQWASCAPRLTWAWSRRAHARGSCLALSGSGWPANENGGAGVSRGDILRHSVLVLASIIAGIIFLGGAPSPQDLAYHRMADARPLLGIPNCLNVLSNLPFAFVGLFGLGVVFRRKAGSAALFADPWERWPYAILFAGITLTTLGSGYYHLSPDNARLVWDRLPMTFGFMGLLTALLAERVGLQVGRLLFGPLLLLGAGSVVYWYWSEVHHHGDLRLYFLVQYGSLLLVLLLLLLYPARYPGSAYLVVGLGAYAVAKWLEAADQRIFALGQIVSGHTLKHLAAAGAIACLLTMLRARVRRAELLPPNQRVERPGEDPTRETRTTATKA